MREVIAECTQTYVGARRVTVGTRAVIIESPIRFPILSVRLQIMEPKNGTEFRIGDIYDIPTSDLFKFWKTLPEPQ